MNRSLLPVVSEPLATYSCHCDPMKVSQVSQTRPFGLVVVEEVQQFSVGMGLFGPLIPSWLGPFSVRVGMPWKRAGPAFCCRGSLHCCVQKLIFRMTCSHPFASALLSHVCFAIVSTIVCISCKRAFLADVVYSCKPAWLERLSLTYMCVYVYDIYTSSKMLEEYLFCRDN